MREMLLFFYGAAVACSLTAGKAQAAGLIDCGSTPVLPTTEYTKEFKDNAGVNANLFTRILSYIEIKNTVNKVQHEVGQKFADPDRMLAVTYFLHISCQNIMKRNDIDAGRKQELWNTVFLIVYQPAKAEALAEPHRDGSPPTELKPSTPATKPPDVTVAGQPENSHISGNDCTSDGPQKSLVVTANPGWKLVPGTAKIVVELSIIGSMRGPQPSDTSPYRAETTFYARRDHPNCHAGGVTAHLEATQTWIGSP